MGHNRVNSNVYRVRIRFDKLRVPNIVKPIEIFCPYIVSDLCTT